MAKYWLYNGTPVKTTATGNKLAKFKADNEHLTDANKCTKAQYDAEVAKIAKRDKRIQRAAAMPNAARRVDAIFAALEHLRANGETFPAEVVEVMDEVKAAKDANPID